MKGQFQTFASIFDRLKSTARWIEGKLADSESPVARKLGPIKNGLNKIAGFFSSHPVLSFAIFFLLVSSRAIFWLLNPQFYIEDGPQFYGLAHNLGASSLPRVYASYFHAVPRLLSLIASSLPVRYGPLAMELLALAVQAGVSAYVASGALKNQIPSNLTRVSLAFLIVAFPYSNELFANVAHAQWYLGILSVGIVCASRPRSSLVGAISSLVLTLNCLTGPFAPLLAVVAWVRFRRNEIDWISPAITTITAVITLFEIFTHPRSGIHSHSRLSLLERMISNQVVLGPLRGLKYVMKVDFEPLFSWSEFSLACFGVAILVYGLRRSSGFFRALGALGLFSFLTSLDSRASWGLLGAPGVGERYFFYLGLVFLYCLWICSKTVPLATARWFLRFLLSVSTISIMDNWIYAPPFHRFDYPPQIAAYDRTPVGKPVRITIPIDRKSSKYSWIIDLIKK